MAHIHNSFTLLQKKRENTIDATEQRDQNRHQNEKKKVKCTQIESRLVEQGNEKYVEQRQ